MANFEQPEQQSNQIKQPVEPVVGDVLYVDERTGRNVVRSIGYSAAVHSSFETIDPQEVIIPYLAN